MCLTIDLLVLFVQLIQLPLVLPLLLIVILLEALQVLDAPRDGLGQCLYQPRGFSDQPIETSLQYQPWFLTCGVVRIRWPRCPLCSWSSALKGQVLNACCI